MPDLSPRTPIVDAPLSVILLSHGDQPELEDVVSAWSALLDELARPAAEILLVQDSFTDAAAQRADSLAQRSPRLRVLRLQTPLGEGGALQTGILAAQYPLVAIAPADKQFQPADLKRLLGEINQVDLVTGYRVHRPVPGWLSALDFCGHWLARLLAGYETERRDAWLGWSGWGRRWLARWVFGLRVNDAECVFRLARREIFRRIPIQSRTALAHFEVLAKANHLGAWMAQVPVSWIPPKATTLHPALRRQMRAELLQLFKRPDFSAVALKESLTCQTTTAFWATHRYRLPKNLSEFALAYEACFEQAVRRRMAQVGVPDSMIGSVKGDLGAFSTRHAVGGTNALPLANQLYVPGINVDPALLDGDLVDSWFSPSWRTARWIDRLDALIAHEYEEALAPLTANDWDAINHQGYASRELIMNRHQHALVRGPTTALKISFQARKILAEHARSSQLQ